MARALRAPSSSRIRRLALLLLLAAGCDRLAPTPEVTARPAASPASVPKGDPAATETRAKGPAPAKGDASASVGTHPSAPPQTTDPKPAIERDRYAWLESSAPRPAEAEPLIARYPDPPGYTRVALEPGSFGDWLRGLPLAAPGTPVKSYRGEVRYAADDRRIASVVAIDVGTADLQQCADSVMRLHGEWAWSSGRRDMSYRAAGGLALPYERFARGERVAMEEGQLTWKAGRAPAAGHAGFREFMNMVFAWSNTVSLSRQATEVVASDVRPGDFFVMPGNPGHTVLLLDLARDTKGNAVALIGQSYMPAQSFYVLRGDRDPWFSLEVGKPVDTPFWQPFPWTALRRLDG